MVGIVQTQKMILTSTSYYRRHLLQGAGVEIEVMASPYDEEANKAHFAHLPIPEQARALARGKALAVSQAYPDHWVIAADQIGELAGEPLFKPLVRDSSIAMLSRMQGKTHQQHCAACVYQGDELLFEVVDTVDLTMRPLSREEIIAYVDMDEPFGCCGSYRYEGMGKYLFASVSGCYDAVLGLPLLSLLNFFQDRGALSLSSCS